MLFIHVRFTNVNWNFLAIESVRLGQVNHFFIKNNYSEYIFILKGTILFFIRTKQRSLLNNLFIYPRIKFKFI